jgi:NitT/TauT family transport system substrate-binding protein
VSTGFHKNGSAGRGTAWYRRGVLLAVLVGTLGVCIGSAQATQTSQSSDVGIRFIAGGAQAIPIFCYLTAGLPDNLGLYHQQHVSVNLLGAVGTGTTLQALAAGQADMAVTAPDSIARLLAQGIDPHVTMVYAQEKTVDWRIVVKPGSSIKSLADLKGKKIGVLSFGISVYPGTQAMLKELGMDPAKDVQFVALGSEGPMGRSLENGTVDAVALTAYEAAVVEDGGYKLQDIPLTPGAKATFGLSIAVRDGFLQQYPKAVTGFLRAVTQGIILMENNPQTCVKYHWKIHPEGIPQSVSKKQAFADAVHETKAQAKAFSANPDKKAQPYGYVDIARLKQVFNLYGLKYDAENAGKIFDMSLISKINNFDVKKWTAHVKTLKAP